MNPQTLIPHLFRTEFSKLCAVLTKLFGIGQMGVAEDIVSETFLSALQTWPYRGLPENPTAWLYTVARNKTKNYLHRQQTFTASVLPGLKAATSSESAIDLSEKNIADSQLQMLFTLCHPCLPPEAQIGLSLRILCGFGIDEIATAFLASKDTINKRLYRAKEKLRQENIAIAFPAPAEINNRLNAVLTTLYLLFSEGYYSENKEGVIREELCEEAMRLCFLLTENEQTNRPAVNALYALFCFHASRLPARKSNRGEVIFYAQQDQSLWDQALVSRGALYLQKAATGSSLSTYHLEAAIGYWHTVKEETPEKWQTILQLYDHLLQMAPSPVAALNRLYALAKVYGKEEAIRQAEKLELAGNHFYFVLLGELYTELDNRKAKDNFEKAFQLAKTGFDKETIAKKLAAILSAPDG
jgi:RNA polymerase sigma factor (sigma-70 family)